MTKLLIWLLCKLLYYKAKYYDRYIDHAKGRLTLTYVPMYNIQLAERARQALLAGNMVDYRKLYRELHRLEGSSESCQELNMLRVIKENTP